MILGVDASRLVGPRTGPGIDLEDLLLAWSREAELPFDRVELYSRGPIGAIALDERFRLYVLPSRVPGPWWRTVRLGPRARDADVLLAQYMLPLAFRGRSVLLNHGILEGAHRPPAWDVRNRLRRWHYRYSARRADVVIANSTALRDELVRWYRVAPGKVRVSHPAVRDIFRPPQPGDEGETERAVEHVLGMQAPYVLFVGMIAPRRHVPRLIEAFARVRRDDLRLLIVGPNIARLPLRELAQRAGVRGRVVHHEYVENDALARLYRGASAFCLPSTQESWSHTIAEALASACPVVAVDGPWLEPDAVREAVLAVSEPRVDLLADALARALDGDIAAGLRTRGLTAAAAFRSPAALAGEVMDALVGVARSGPRRSRR